MRPVRRHVGLVMGCGELLVSRHALPKRRVVVPRVTRPRRQGEAATEDRR